MITTATTPPTKWGRFPSAWVTSGGLSQFQVHSKASLAALRVYLAMAVWTARQEFAEAQGVFIAFSVTYDDLQRNSHSDRSEILPALTLLQEKGLLTFGNSGRGTRNVYQLLGEPSKGWAKVPESLLDKFQSLNLKHTTVPGHGRRQILLDALKLYILFLALRDKITNRAKVSYDRICELTGIRRGGVRSALSFLTSLKLIHIENFRNPDQAGPNLYFMLDLAKFQPLQSFEYDKGKRQAS